MLQRYDWGRDRLLTWREREFWRQTWALWVEDRFWRFLIALGLWELPWNLYYRQGHFTWGGARGRAVRKSRSFWSYVWHGELGVRYHGE